MIHGPNLKKMINEHLQEKHGSIDINRFSCTGLLRHLEALRQPKSLPGIVPRQNKN